MGEALPISLKVRSISVKSIKVALEAHLLLNKGIKIRPSPQDDNYFSIPLKASHGIKMKAGDEQNENVLYQLLSSIGMEEHLNNVKFSTQDLLDCHEIGNKPNRPDANDTGGISKANSFQAAVDAWLESLPAQVTVESNSIMSFNKTPGYNVYPPMLLLSSSFPSKFLQDEEISKHLPKLYECLSKSFKVTHIALNAPIPALSLTENMKASPNIMRSPSGLTPLYGDFGPSLPGIHIPSSSDFESAFWCSARQNGIFQTWAPRHTMFSRGNISEKARILNLAERWHANIRSITDNVVYMPKDSTAVDLYAGIGYFAFSYVKAGLSKVLCWEINSWSVEGLRRGAMKNGWKTITVTENEDSSALLQRIDDENPRLIIFHESNNKAPERIMALLSPQLPSRPIAPIRHVNCGYLPSSKDSWKMAVDVLDKYAGGWIHVHENIGKSDIEARKDEIVDIFRLLTDGKFALTDGSEPSGSCSVVCEHLEHVKSYAPGVIHCVLDIGIITSYK